MPKTFYDLERLIADDLQTRPGGYKYNDRAIELGQLFEDRATALTMRHLHRLGVGEVSDHSISVSILRRVIQELAVVYRTPPTRELVDASGAVVSEAAPEAVAMRETLDRAQYDLQWQTIDELRTLYRQVLVVFHEDHHDRQVQTKIFEPYNFARRASARAADRIDQDEAVALLVRDGANAADGAGQLWELWIHADDGSWLMFLVDGVGNKRPDSEQPYEGGIVPYGTFPASLVFDELPRGRSYLPQNETRLNMALAVNAIINDLSYLVRMESHTPLHLKTDDRRNAPSSTGPGKIHLTDTDSDFSAIATNPKIREMGEVLDQTLRLFSTGECLPPDLFRVDRSIMTGQALKVQQMPLEARRKRQIPLAERDERIAYDRLRAVHNAFAAQWGRPMLAEDLELRASIGSVWQPVDPRELQESYFKDIAMGVASPIDYLIERYGYTRAQAIRAYERAQADRAAYPIGQNPGAMTETRVADQDATKTPGELNPDLTTASEGASVVDAARRFNG